MAIYREDKKLTHEEVVEASGEDAKLYIEQKDGEISLDIEGNNASLGYLLFLIGRQNPDFAQVIKDAHDVLKAADMFSKLKVGEEE